MKKINVLLTGVLILTIAFCYSAAFAKAQNNKQYATGTDNQAQNQNRNQGSINGEQHRNTISTFVQGLLETADSDQDGIGQEVQAVATEQNESKDKVADIIDKINNRNGIKTFLIGTDYKNIGELRSETVRNENQISQLKNLLDKTMNTEIKTSLQAQIQTLEQERSRIENFIKTNESKFSLFGWLVRLFNK